MSSEECPHGLDPEWCSLCRAAASGARPAGVKSRPAPKPARRAVSATAAPRSRTPRAAPAVGPVAGLARARRSLFHATAYGSWESILESGLRSAAQILDGPTLRFRERDVVLDAPQGGQFRVRDQRLMAHNRIEDHLDSVDLAGWLRLLDHRVFLFAQQRDLLTHLARTQNTVGQDVVVFDTARLTAAAAGRVEVTLAAPAAPDAYGYCPCRGPGLFVPLGAFHGDPADVVDVAVVDGLASVECLVSRVMRYHPGRPPEVLVG